MPIFYVPRQIPLKLKGQDEIDTKLEEIIEEHEIDDKERRKSRWATMAKAAGAKERVKELANDLLSHYLDRNATLDGKAMVVCMTREYCVRLRTMVAGER